jgi:serine/threonine protein kinase
MRPEERVTRDGARQAALGELLERYRIAVGRFPGAGAGSGESGGLDAVLPWTRDGSEDAPTLPVLLDALGPLEPSAVAALALGLVEALEPLHAVGAVRGDLKPLNVLLDMRGVGLRPVDFISALGVDGLLHADFGSALDDPLYLAPEQILNISTGP